MVPNRWVPFVSAHMKKKLIGQLELTKTYNIAQNYGQNVLSILQINTMYIYDLLDFLYFI